jgi:hypothetical protein
MLFAIEDIEITDLVSESKAYARYQLDGDSKISIKAWAKDKLLRDIYIGKEAATYQHTFIRFPGNSNVYHARGDFRRKFDQGSAELRDREVFAFDPDTLKRIQVTIGEDILEITRKETQKGEKQGSGKEGDMATEVPKHIWLAADGREVDGNTVVSFLSTINNLKCVQYLEGRQMNDFANPSLMISLDGEKTYTLSVFKKEAGNDQEVPAISSINAYPFTLSDGKLKNLKKTITKLLNRKEALQEE